VINLIFPGVYLLDQLYFSLGFSLKTRI